MKKLLCSIAITIGVSAGHLAAEDPNFSLKNKSGQSIVIEITNSALKKESPKAKCVLRNIEQEKEGKKEEMMSDYCQIGKGNIYRLQDDRSIAFVLPEAKMPESMYNLNIWYEMDEKSSYPFELEQGQTFYAKVSKKGNLEAQQGSGFLNKKTTEGFSLKNNIKIPKPTVYKNTSYKSRLKPDAEVIDFDTMHIR